jgi:hypothetical protein
MSTVVLSTYKVANFPGGGGHFWVYMQYAQGLRRLGCDVYWLEQLRPSGGPGEEQRLCATLLERMERFGFAGKTLLYVADPRAVDGVRFVASTDAQAKAVLRQADVLLNFHYAIDPRLLGWARRTALVEIDPGLLQFWMSTGQLAVARHDHYLTTGETVGTPEARFPDCGVPWTRIRPPVCLDLWPVSYTPGAEAFTTVSSWSSASWLKVKENGQTALRDNTKRIAFLEYVDLPRQVARPLELALYLLDRDPAGQARRKQAEQDAADRSLLERHGWRVRDSREVAGSPDAYRSYVQASRGEFSCAKPSCMEFRNAWVSDRSVCYLASGKPIVVQDTGPSNYLPDGEGIFRFSSIPQAAAALDAIESDYQRQCDAARALAETYFDAGRVIEHALNATLRRAPAMAMA